MHEVLLQMTGLVSLGAVWRILNPGGIDALTARRVLTDLVYYLLLPVLVFQVMSKTPLGLDSLRISILAASGVFSGMLLSWLICRSCQFSKATTGAVVLAAAFPNATYLGLPVLEATLGPAARSIAIQYDLFACLPLLLTVGLLLADRFGHGREKKNLFFRLLQVPALQALVLAVVVQHFDIKLPGVVDSIIDRLAILVIPLMLFSLGLSLQLRTLGRANWPAIGVVSIIQLILVPALVFGLSPIIGLEGVTRTGVVLVAAMPSMVLGVVICDRFGLDTGMYAGAVTVTTLLSLLTLPLWFTWAS